MDGGSQRRHKSPFPLQLTIRGAPLASIQGIRRYRRRNRYDDRFQVTPFTVLGLQKSSRLTAKTGRRTEARIRQNDSSYSVGGL